MALWWGDKGFCLAALQPQRLVPSRAQSQEPVHDCISVSDVGTWHSLRSYQPPGATQWRPSSGTSAPGQSVP